MKVEYKLIIWEGGEILNGERKESTDGLERGYKKYIRERVISFI